MALILSAFAAGLQILAAHRVIARIIGEGWFALRGLLQMPAVELVVNVALIALETLLLLRISAWLKTGFQALEVRVRREKNRRLKGFSIQKVQVFTASQLTGFLLGLSRYARYTSMHCLRLSTSPACSASFPGPAERFRVPSAPFSSASSMPGADFWATSRASSFSCW